MKIIFFIQFKLEIKTSIDAHDQSISLKYYSNHFMDFITISNENFRWWYQGNCNLPNFPP